MKREFISIPEIIIKNHNPQDIIFKAVKAVTHNYGDTPAAMTGFYREGVMKKSELQTYSEAILQIYKSSYAGTLLLTRLKYIKAGRLKILIEVIRWQSD
jgi:expansin (peptidoglycan-binding protein)